MKGTGLKKKILAALKDGPGSARHISKRIKERQLNVSQALRNLKHDGAVTVQDQTRPPVYQLVGELMPERQGVRRHVLNGSIAGTSGVDPNKVSVSLPAEPWEVGG